MMGIFMQIDTFGKCGIVVILVLIAVIIVMQISFIKAQAKINARAEFLSNMSHEIRTPLNALIGLNHLMEQNIGNRERMQTYLQKADTTANYLLTLLNDILDMSKLSGKHVMLEQYPLMLEQVISDVASMQQENMNAKGQAFQVTVELSSPCIIGDAVRLKQVLMNILGNAVKFTPQNGKITMKVTQHKNDKACVTTRFEITDTGCGMSKEFQKKIFETFTQEHNQNSSGNMGTGLGMSISYQLVKRMGGNLYVNSELDQGSCFVVELPAQTAEPAKAPSAEALNKSKQLQETDASVPETPSLAVKKRNILLAEDNELNAGILKEILLSEGYDVTVAENGKRAVELFENSEWHQFDVILMDVKMPVMNGYEAAKRIREMNRPDAESVQICACTANTSREDKQRAAQYNMNGFLAKPIDIDVLLGTLQNILTSKPEKAML